MTHVIRRFAAAMAVVLACAGAAAQAQTEGPVTAGYVELSLTEVPVRVILTGRAVAQSATQLRPRVGGAVTAILYTPGSRVEAGTPLFEIDPLAWRAALASAEASLARAAADLQQAETAFARVSALRGTAASQAALDQAETELLKAKASHAEAEAAAELARAELAWTTVRAPITGIVGVAQVAVGDLVTQNQTQPLAEIVQVDPIHIDLSEPYPARLRIEARAARGEIVMTEPQLTLVLDGGRRIEGRSKLISTGATVSATTGTRILRFETDNPGGLIAPGMFLQGELVLGRQQAILVPQRATQRERDGRLSAWVVEDGKAARRWLTETGTWGSSWVIQAGLTPGEWLLMDGITNLREGQEIDPVPVVIDDQGVVRDRTGDLTGAGN